MADSPPPQWGIGFPNRIPRSRNRFLTALRLAKDIYDAVHRRRHRYDDRPQPRPLPPPPPPPPVVVDPFAWMEFREPVLGPILRVTEADLSSDPPPAPPTPATRKPAPAAPTATPARTKSIPATTKTKASPAPPTSTPSTTNPSPAATPATTNPSSATPTPTPTASRTIQRQASTSAPSTSNPSPALTPTPTDPLVASSLCLASPWILLGDICSVRNAFIHGLPDATRYLALLLAAAGIGYLAWMFARSGHSHPAGRHAEDGVGLPCLATDGDHRTGAAHPLLDRHDEYQSLVFREFSLNEIQEATDGFASERILLSQDGYDDAPNIVYRGIIRSSGLIVAVKRFQSSAWPNSDEFLKKAKAFGELGSGMLSHLIGCVENGERMLVTQLIPCHISENHLQQGS